jgi:predicted ATP-grasp superfamily ATP-dependent carboligase
VVVAHWDDDDLAASSRHAAATVRVPQPDAGDGAFVESLLALADDYPGAVLIPTTDGAVKDMAMSKATLERHFLVDCPAWDVAELFIDKRHTYDIAADLGIALPRTLVPDGAGDLEALASELRFPCLVKPRESHLWAARFGGKYTLVDSLEEMRASYAVASEAGLEVVIQELIVGRDRNGVNYNAFRTADGVVADCTARKIRQGPPRSGLPRVVISAEVPEVVEPAKRLLEALGVEGFACVEFRRDDRDGTYKLLEVNGRHNLSSLLSIRCGLNFPWIAYRHIVAGEIPEPVRARSGLYWIDEWLELAFNRSRAGRDSDTWRQILRPWVRDHVFAVFDRSDPGPSRLLARQILGDARRVAAQTVRQRLGQG